MPVNVSIEGFKAIGDRVDVVLRPLTILAGANSSGKSSLMQGILLLKQTIEASYDPGPILLNGPHVRFTSIDQILHTGVAKSSRTTGFTVGINDGKVGFETHIKRQGTKEELVVSRFKWHSKGIDTFEFTPHMDTKDLTKWVQKRLPFPLSADHRLEIIRDRFALVPALVNDTSIASSPTRTPLPFFSFDLGLLRKIIHIPGLRGNPARSYPLTATGPFYPGTFENYSASVIAGWNESQTGDVQRMFPQGGSPSAKVLSGRKDLQNHRYLH